VPFVNPIIFYKDGTSSDPAMGDQPQKTSTHLFYESFGAGGREFWGLV
jgi:hypothetical protein